MHQISINKFIIIKPVKYMIRIILQLVDRIDEIKGFFVSIISACTGSILSVSDSHLNAISSADPTWYIVASPFMQMLAWIVAIVAGAFTIAKACRKNK
jgi:hypothetical protein